MSEAEPDVLPKIAVPRGPPRPAHAWDEAPPSQAPYSFGKSWYESTTVADRLDTSSSLYKGYPKPVLSLHVRSLKTKQPLELPLGGERDHSVADVKVAFRKALVISSRKAITLRWQGHDLPDGKTLGELRVPDGATLEAAFRTRGNDELEALKTVTHVLVCDQDGEVALAEVTSATIVGDVKAQCKLLPPMPMYFSPHYTSAFGTPLINERTLGSYAVLDGDVLYVNSKPLDGDGAAAAAPPPKKK